MGTQYETQYKDGETPDHISSCARMPCPDFDVIPFLLFVTNCKIMIVDEGMLHIFPLWNY